MTESAYCKNERANPHCEELALSNLVKLDRHQMWDDSSTEPHHLVNPPSTDCFRKGATLLGFPCWRSNPAFVGGVERYYVNTDAVDHCKGCLSRVRDLYVVAIESVRPPFTKAVCNQRRINVDRVSIRKGQGPGCARSARKFTGYFRTVWCGCNSRWPFTNADSVSRCFLSARLRSDSLYQPHSGSYPVGIMWLEGKQLGVLVPALQASKGSSKRDVMTFFSQGLVCPDTT